MHLRELLPLLTPRTPLLEMDSSCVTISIRTGEELRKLVRVEHITTDLVCSNGLEM